MITPHLERFTLRDKPTPCIYNRSDKTCRRIVSWNLRRPVIYEAMINSEGSDPLITAKIYNGEIMEAEEIIKHIYNTEYEYPEIKLLLKICPGLSRILGMYPGLRPALNPSLRESLVKTIISQQIPLKLANIITAKLVEEKGKRVIIGRKVFYDIPDPYVIAESSIEELRKLGLSRSKAEYLISIAREIADGYDIEGLVRYGAGEAIRELQRFKGIGLWTAKLAYMATTGDLSLLLSEDLSVDR